jgi:hypothetical protein
VAIQFFIVPIHSSPGLGERTKIIREQSSRFHLRRRQDQGIEKHGNISLSSAFDTVGAQCLNKDTMFQKLAL